MTVIVIESTCMDNLSHIDLYNCMIFTLHSLCFLPMGPMQHLCHTCPISLVTFFGGGGMPILAWGLTGLQGGWRGEGASSSPICGAMLTWIVRPRLLVHTAAHQKVSITHTSSGIATSVHWWRTCAVALHVLVWGGGGQFLSKAYCSL